MMKSQFERGQAESSAEERKRRVPVRSATRPALADVLADALPRFSLDIVKIVRGYLPLFPCATAGATPTLVLTIGSEGNADGQFSIICYGIAVSPVDNTVWISSYDKVQIFSDEGKFLRHAAKGQWKDACDITFAGNGEAYIADYGAHCIVVCRPDGSVERRIGSKGSGDGQFVRPWYNAIDNKQGLLFVTESGNNRVQVLTLDGSFVRIFGALGSGDGQFNRPRGIALSAAGEVAVADEGNNCLQIFDYNGKFLRKFGSLGSANGQLKYPHGLAVDSAGQWLVCDQGNRRVQVFSADGSLITAFAVNENERGHPQLNHPYSVCVDADGRILVGDGRRVQVFAFGCQGPELAASGAEENVEAKQPRSSADKKTSLADGLADALPRFSLDIVKIVHGYLISPPATAGATPQLLLTIGSNGDAGGLFESTCCGVACSPVDNTIWISSGSAVRMFSDEGKFLRHSAKGQWQGARGIAFAANGESYITERSSNYIAVCRPEGIIGWRIGSKGSGDGQFYRPWNIAVDSEQGLLFVTEGGNHRVQVLKLDGSFVRQFGGWGSGDGQFRNPRGIALSAAGEVAVADSQNHRVQIFDYNGKFLRKFGSRGSANGQLKYPLGLAVDSAGQWIVADRDNHRVCVFTAEGSFVTAFGEEGHQAGKFSYVWAVCVDAAGRIFVADEECRVQVFAFGCTCDS